MDMSLGMAYRFLNNDTTLTEAHSHNYYEYFFITGGSVTHEINGISYKMNAGDMAFIRPRDCHRYLLNKETGCSMINISFRTAYFEEIKTFESRLAKILTGELYLGRDKNGTVHSYRNGEITGTVFSMGDLIDR